jgi:hypothetical protein
MPMPLLSSFSSGTAKIGCPIRNLLARIIQVGWFDSALNLLSNQPGRIRCLCRAFKYYATFYFLPSIFLLLDYSVRRQVQSAPQPVLQSIWTLIVHGLWIAWRYDKCIFTFWDLHESLIRSNPWSSLAFVALYP